MMAYIYSVTRAVSRLLNAIIGGWSGETLSGRAWREKHWWAVDMLDTVWLWLGDDPAHCLRSFYMDRENTDYPKG